MENIRWHPFFIFYNKMVMVKHLRPIFNVFLYFLFFLCVVSCAEKRSQTDESIAEKGDIYQNMKMWTVLNENNEFDSVLYYTEKYLNRSDIETRDRAYAMSYLTQGVLLAGDVNSAGEYLDRMAVDFDNLIREDCKLRMMYHNMKAIYIMQTSWNYAAAMESFHIAMESARMMNDYYNECIFMCNISSLYYIRRDTSGISYSKRAYEIASEHRDSYLKCFAAVNLASMYFLMEKDVLAEKYVEEADSISSGNYLMDEICLLYATRSIREGDYLKAEKYYRKALDHLGEEKGTNAIRIYYLFGVLLLDNSEYERALSVLGTGLGISQSTNNLEFRSLLYEGISQCYDGLGMSDSAYVYYKKYNELNNSIFSMQNEREFNTLLMKYEKAVYDSKLQRSEKRAYLLFSAVFLVSFICLGLYVMYKRKNMMYRQLVEKHQQFLYKFEKMNAAYSETKPSSRGSIESDREKELYDRITRLMKEDGLFRSKDISLDMIADKLDSNRAYVSKVINKYSGMSFYSYINTFRIEEAIRLLSNETEDIPLKQIYSIVGYNSVSSFYNAFQKETGCPPSKYRKQIFEMKRNTRD